MRPCPSCLGLGIYEHSVTIRLDEVRASGPSEVTSYSRCLKCDVLFRRDETGGFAATPPDTADTQGLHAWIIPPWKKPSDEGSFELSWDVIQCFFEREAERDASLRPLQRLVCALRAEGFGTRLRAGQSLNSLGLSRAKEHGLGPGHSSLFLRPSADGLVEVVGKLGAEGVRFGPIDPVFAGPLRLRIEELAQLPLE